MQQRASNTGDACNKNLILTTLSPNTRIASNKSMHQTQSCKQQKHARTRVASNKSVLYNTKHFRRKKGTKTCVPVSNRFIFSWQLDVRYYKSKLNAWVHRNDLPNPSKLTYIPGIISIKISNIRLKIADSKV